ncbi:hypothetical protein RhiJN_20605 [Ceratobasidium sp. AG-Ba]|nr:hypothetical protein RhiJN_20605 [Ceratobasidium sp. AG-Ba]
MVSLTKGEQHQVRQQLEHAEAQKRKAERRAAHERRMHQQAEEAARARAERARRHQMLKEEEARRRRAKEARRGYPSSTASSSHSSWTEYDFGARSSTWQDYTDANYWEREGVARYETGWERMRQVIGANQATLTFSDIPWPTLHRINSSRERHPGGTS